MKIGHSTEEVEEGFEKADKGFEKTVAARM